VAAPTITKKPAQPNRRPKPRQLPFPVNIYQTAVGKKWAMALSGIALLGFVFFHMLGNLKIWLGEVENEAGVLQQDIDIYAEFLREIGEPLFPYGSVLWLLRIGLIGAFALHIHAAYSLTRLNQASNVRYQSKPDWLASNFASRTMRVSGVIVLFYLIFHLADLTWGWIPGYDWEYGEVYNNLQGSLGNPLVAAVYIVANALLALHIYHGAWSMFQSLGINNPRFNAARRYFAAGFALVILVGNVSLPVSILAGWV
jgi:succinate dehydrogenase / fumarate reductase cytochrome b subunit